MKNFLVLALSVMALGLVVSGCSGGEEAAPAEPAGEGTATAAPADGGEGNATPMKRELDIK